MPRRRLHTGTPTARLLLLGCLLLLLRFPTATGVDLRDVALVGIAASIPEFPELDVNAMARGIGKLTCVGRALRVKWRIGIHAAGFHRPRPLVNSIDMVDSIDHHQPPTHPPSQPRPTNQNKTHSKTETFQEIKQGVSDLGLGDMAQDLDLSEAVQGLPPGLRLRTPGLCAYYDDAAAVCHFHSANGVRARVAGPCSAKLNGVVPTW
jgi:hypothetical protein